MVLRTKSGPEKAREAAQDALETVQPAAEAAMEKISVATEQLAATVGPALGEARDRARPIVEDAIDRLVPLVEEAVEKITPLAQEAIAGSKEQGRRAAVKLGIVEEPKTGHKLRNFVIVLGLGVLIAVAYKKFTGKDADPAWTASRDSAAARPPAHAARPTTGGSGATAPVDGSDTAPTAPLASEEKVESPTPTTPDKPLTQKKV